MPRNDDAPAISSENQLYLLMAHYVHSYRVAPKSKPYRIITKSFLSQPMRSDFFRQIKVSIKNYSVVILY